jgi:hypothetical protein
VIRNKSLSTTYQRNGIQVIVVSLPNIAAKECYDAIIESPPEGIFLVDGPTFHSNFFRILRTERDQTGQNSERSSSVYIPKFTGFGEASGIMDSSSDASPQNPKLPNAVHTRLGSTSIPRIKQPWELFVQNKSAVMLGAPIRSFYRCNPNLASRKYFYSKLKGVSYIRTDRDMDAALLGGFLLWAFSGNAWGVATLFYLWKYERENNLLRKLQSCIDDKTSDNDRKLFTICWGPLHAPRVEAHLHRSGFTKVNQLERMITPNITTALWAFAIYIYSLPIISFALFLFAIHTITFVVKKIADTIVPQHNMS